MPSRPAPTCLRAFPRPPSTQAPTSPALGSLSPLFGLDSPCNTEVCLCSAVGVRGMLHGEEKHVWVGGGGQWGAKNPSLLPPHPSALGGLATQHACASSSPDLKNRRFQITWAPWRNQLGGEVQKLGERDA